MSTDDEDDDREETTGGINVPLLSKVPGKIGYLMVVGTAADSITGQMFRLDRAEMILGRGAKADVRVEDEGISRSHARLISTGPGCFRLVDLGSRNGTYLNGERIRSAELKDGDRVQVGSTAVLLFSIQDELEEQFTLRMFKAATHDGLTRLFNKKYLFSALDHELAFARRYRSPLSVMMVDVDHFKKINDTLGHPVGDRVLVRLAERLTQLIRREDSLARYGGEEFLSLLRQADEASARTCAERCRAGIEGLRVTSGDQVIPLTVSIGLATLNPGESATRDAMVAKADANLYLAKNAGRNCIVASSCAT